MFTDEGFAGEGALDPSHPVADGEPAVEEASAASNQFFDAGGLTDDHSLVPAHASSVDEPVPDLVRHEATGTPPDHARDIVYTGADGTEIQLGAPNQDLDGDGVAESVAVRTDSGDILMVSDTNGDGHPDQLIQVNQDTGAATWAVPDHHGGWQVVQTGHMAPDGSLVVDPASQGHSSEHQHTVEVAVHGDSFDAGIATIDSDGDGVPDTVSVAGPAGSTLFYQDSNGDGIADRAWSTDSSGHITSSYTIGAGGTWVSTAVAGGV